MLFEIKIDAAFEAENIDDAISKLEDHFKNLHDPCYDNSAFFTKGYMNISKANNSDG